MSKLKIRNAGFERGNTDFWVAYSDAVLSAYSADQKYGVYSGRAEYNTASIDGLMTADYIDVAEGEIIKIGGYIRPSATRWGGIRVLQYDGDYSLIGTEDVAWIELAASWNYVSGFLNVPQDVEFLRIGFVNGTLSADKSLLVDAPSAIRVDESFVQPLGAVVRTSAEFNASFNTISARVNLMGCRDLYASMDYGYTSGSATSITLRVREIGYHVAGNYEVASHGIAAVNTSEETRIPLVGATGKELYIDCLVDTPSSLVATMGVSVVGSRI